MRRWGQSISKSSNPVASKKTKFKEKVHCFNRGELDHKSPTCESKSKDAKCFGCNEFGHKSIDCKKEKPKKLREGMYKIIKIAGKQFNALVDILAVSIILLVKACMER